MEIDIIKSSKDEIEFKTDNLTIAEILRVYLNKDSTVIFAAWKQDHPTEKIIMSVKTKDKTAKKAVNDAVSSITKELDKTLKDFSKMK
ncbi:hypothetical protein CMI44_00955 [Candidatus Pacearchaeota archaeon]|jgi:DNA-directed RNA polymerase subunit L|nr:hypothetical protein [Candidatus Pacearchaeota archaeon]|tara:strand:- start:218 stop:481 length:264 start_codon:yes stop_codon:yes gene_type:complete